MKITFFISALIGGGAEHVTCKMANYLVGAGHRVSILTMAETASYYLAPQVLTSSLLEKGEGGNAVKSFFLRIKRLKRYLKTNDCDIYIVMLPITTILLLAFSRFASVPIIASERSSPSRNPKWIQALLKKLSHRASGWVFQTPAVLEWYRPYIGETPSVIIPNAIDKELMCQADETEKEKIIVSVGRLHPAKRFDILINAFSIIANNFPDYKLVIYGEGGKRGELEELVDSLSLRDKVLMPGFSTNVNHEIKKASLYVLSSDYEGMPNALMESMALSIPCVSTDCDGGGAKFLIKDGINGLLVPKGNVEELAKAMAKMLDDREFAKQCGKEAHKICDSLSPEKIYGQWECYINEIIKK